MKYLSLAFNGQLSVTGWQVTSVNKITIKTLSTTETTATTATTINNYKLIIDFFWASVFVVAPLFEVTNFSVTEKTTAEIKLIKPIEMFCGF